MVGKKVKFRFFFLLCILNITLLHVILQNFYSPGRKTQTESASWNHMNSVYQFFSQNNELNLCHMTDFPIDVARNSVNDTVEYSNIVYSHLIKWNFAAGNKSKIVSEIRNAPEDLSVFISLLFTKLLKNMHFNKRQKDEMEDLSDIVQSRIHILQNPRNCSSAKKLLCHLDTRCGYGCQIHRMAHCLIIAYKLKRTLLLNFNKSPSAKWTAKLLPLPGKCGKLHVKGAVYVPGKIGNQHANENTLEIISSEQWRVNYSFMPPAIPEDLGPRLSEAHGIPSAWWVGQFIKYILKPLPFFEKDVEYMKKDLKFENPIVGIHVRRTDKLIKEAESYDLEEYMKYVTEWYCMLSKYKVVTSKRVYLATDEPKLLAEATEKYPDYEFISNTVFSNLAAIDERRTEQSFRGFLNDVYLLSMSDYLVCTFSSNVCRLAYEIMQTFHTDASQWAHSLDYMYYFGITKNYLHLHVAVIAHHAQHEEEIDLQAGDLVRVDVRYNSASSYYGLNERTQKAGTYPSYKVVDRIKTDIFPIY